MKRTRPLVIVIAAVVLVGLAGCTGTATASPAPASATTTPHRVTPTPSPTPTVMTIAEAGKKYLAIVCPANKAGDTVNAAFDKQNLAEIRVAAAKARDAYRVEAVAFADPSTVWPAGIAAELKKLSDWDFGAVSWADAVANAKTLADANAQTLAADGTGAVAQKVRAQLGLPASTKC